MDIRTDSRFRGIQPFANRVWLSSPTMHGDEQRWVDDAIATNWVSTVGRNIDEAEKNIAEIVGVKYSVGLSAGTAALHLATKLAGERLWDKPNNLIAAITLHIMMLYMFIDMLKRISAYELLNIKRKQRRKEKEQP